MAYSKNQHAEWLSLIEVSGPFLAEPILDQAFPQGLEKLNPIKKRQFRQTYDEWREVIDSDAQNDIEIKDKIHQQWIDWVLKFGLELDEDEDGDILKNQSQMSSSIHVHVTEHHVTLKPDYAIIASDEEKPYLLIQTYPPETKLSEVLPGDGWSTSPAERMAHLCRGVGTRLGVITNGEQWMFIDAPIGGITTYASWYARLWGLEPITLQAFYSLFNVGIAFNGFNEAKSLPVLIDESLQYQEDVTHTLGTQVSRAVEVLIQSIDRINHDHNGRLLEGVEPEELYEAGLTFMMRLVFLLCAEERGLLLLGDQAYEANYALSTLRAKLREEASLHGDEVLSYRKNAWSRLLAIFRAVYAGVEHENMRMPALGGSLFDPDRFPFLEGRSKGSNWQEEQAKPLPIDNRTVLLFLDAIQLYQGRTLSYRALDVEQIGYVYEGLLEQTVKRAPDVTLELSGSKSCKKPWVYLGEIASAELDGDAALQKLLKERTGSSVSRITNDLKKEVTDAHVDKLMVACYNDAELCKRIKPYYHFLRFDAWGNPLLYPKDAYMLTTGSDRRETGSHYTPKSLTESVVKETLEPIVYVGPTEGKPRDEWELKSPEELLDLKICDPAMGSGAFLVQVCRWLAERVCEAWSDAEQKGTFINAKGFFTSDESEELIPKDSEDRLILAKRLISERCLYGVDINPLAIELAKLSIWLVTLSKDRPFGFLDHNFKSGDSLLGIFDLETIYRIAANQSKASESNFSGKSFFNDVKNLVDKSLAARKELISHDINFASDIEEMATLDRQAKESIYLLKLISDAITGLALRNENHTSSMYLLSKLFRESLLDDKESIKSLKEIANSRLNKELLGMKKTRHPFHWCIEYPEVFSSKNGGFDAIVGNPPFLGGQKITGMNGTEYRSYLVNCIAKGKKGSADLVAYFFLQAINLLKDSGTFGLIAVNSISEGDTREVGLEQIVLNGSTIYSANTNEVWPGKAKVITSNICIQKKSECNITRKLNGNEVSEISEFLTTRINWNPVRLSSNLKLVYQGPTVNGKGFILEKNDENEKLLNEYGDVIFPYLTGKEINNDPNMSPGRLIINFWDWTEDEAKKYEEIYSHLKRTTYKERLQQKNRKARDYWWLHYRTGQELYDRIRVKSLFNSARKAEYMSNGEVIVYARAASKYSCFSYTTDKYMFSDSVAVITKGNFGLLAVLSSDLHIVWAWKYGSRMKQDLRYTHGDVFETFPFPEHILEGTHDPLNQLGEKLHYLRCNYMVSNKKGLTQLYNDFHDPSFNSEELTALREMQKKINDSVLDAYGFTDINPDYGFHAVAYLPEGKNTRFTISEKSREEILYRLAMLNKSMSEAE